MLLTTKSQRATIALENQILLYLNWKQVHNPIPQRSREGLAQSTTIILRKGEVLWQIKPMFTLYTQIKNKLNYAKRLLAVAGLYIIRCLVYNKNDIRMEKNIYPNYQRIITAHNI